MGKVDFKSLLERVEKEEKLKGTYLEPLEIELLDEPKFAYDIPREIPIRRKSYWKVLAYPKMIPRVLHSNIECYGLLMGEKDIIEDVYLPPGQRASPGHVRLDNDAIYSARKYFEKSPYSVIGWWHNHATLSTFHSDTDIENFKRIISSTSAYLNYNGERKKYAYSVVVNYKGETYNSIAISDKEGSIRATKKSIPFKFLPGGPDFNPKKLRNEIKERINAPIPKPRWSLLDSFRRLRKWFEVPSYVPSSEPIKSVDQYIQKTQVKNEILDVITLISNGIAPSSFYSTWESEIIRTMRDQNVGLAEAIKIVGVSILERGLKDKYVV